MRYPYRIAKISSAQIQVIRSIGDDEYIQIASDFKILGKFSDIHSRIMLIKSSIDDLKVFLEENNLFRIKRSIIEVLSNFYLFIETMTALSIREYGKKSNEFLIMKNQFSQEFDGYFAYRFLYKLRNMIIHSEFPSFICNSWIDENEESHTILMIKSEELLNTTFDWGAIVKKDLMEKEEIDLISLFDVLEKCIVRIALEYIKFHGLANLYESSRRVLKYQNVIEKGKEQLAIFTYEDFHPSGIPKNFKDFHYFPFFEAEILQNMIVKN
jgi:hypothetical protein